MGRAQDEVIEPNVFGQLEELGRLTNDASFVSRVVNEFVGSLRARGDKLAALVEAGDAEGVMRESHALKSPSRNLGAMHLGALAEQLETLSRAKNLEPAGELVAQLSAEVDEVIVALNAKLAAR